MPDSNNATPPPEGFQKMMSSAPPVAAINPEAGNHPIPADPRELDASLRAAARCWAEFPDLATRFGERGLRFTQSDCAWMATLADLDQATVDEQVQWLARVLEPRGIAPAIQVVSLEILADELTRAVPKRAADYQKLRLAAAALAAVVAAGTLHAESA